MYIRPTEGRHVPDPERGGFLPPHGRYIEASQYWLRRINDGDIVETDPPTEIEITATAQE